jgi:hypothetical protein
MSGPGVKISGNTVAQKTINVTVCISFSFDVTIVDRTALGKKHTTSASAAAGRESSDRLEGDHMITSRKIAPIQLSAATSHAPSNCYRYLLDVSSMA